MFMILDRKRYFGRLAQTLAAGLAVFATAFLVACADDQATQATEGPQPTAAARETAAPSAPPVQVVATTNFVGDWARVVGGDRAEVFSLLPPGGDPHTFQPGARDVARVADADLVLTIGLGLEAQWLEDLLHNASADESKIVALGDGVDPIEFAMVDAHDDHGDEGDDHHGEDGDHEDEGDDHHGEDGDHEDEGDDHHGEDGDHEDEGDDHHGEDGDHEDEGDDHHGEDGDHGDEDGHDGHDHGTLDPHFWFDPIRVKVAVNEIASRLSAVDPDNAGVYFQNASEYAQKLDELHAWILAQVGTVAPERRLLVTSHDSLSYFAKAYGFEVVGLVIPSLATHVEPSAEHIAGLVAAVRERNVPALFGETTVSERLAQAVARETGANLVQLYSGSLGVEGSGADTYLGMVRTNVERIVEALK